MSADQKRARDLANSRLKHAEKREIGPLPPVDNPIRRAEAEGSLRVFCETYFPRVFKLKWSQSHLKAIDRFEKTICQGGLYALAMPRGSGKSALSRAAGMWAVMTGRRKYLLFVAATDNLAKRSLRAIKTNIESNELLRLDFPEVCYPVKMLNRIHQRASGQLLDGKPTDLRWTEECIQFANVEGSKCSGGIIDVVGITGAIRGRNVELRNGEQVRPDYVVIDDAQTKNNAKNPRIVEEIISTIQSDVLGLAGPDVTIAACMLATVIMPDDQADQMLDRELYYEWFGERTSMLESLPVAIDTYWKQYREILVDDLKAGRDHHPNATAYYLLHRISMDDGAEASWQERKLAKEVSAVQHSMNLLFTRGERTFWSEYQNKPKRQSTADNQLSVPLILSRCSGVPRGVVPNEGEKLTAFIDIQDQLLYWMVVAWDSLSFGGSVIDYGSFPEQPSNFFTNTDVKVTLARKLQVDTLEAGWYQGLSILVKDLEERPWHRNGAELQIDKILIDANYGESTDVVYRFCRAKQSPVLLPSHGRYIGQDGTPFAELPRKPGETIGHNWKLPLPNGKRIIRHASWDGNYWKSFVAGRLKIPLGSKNAITVFGADGEAHRMLADHCTAEFATRKSGKRDIEIWKMRPGRTENHWWDCLVGCAVAASMVGCSVLDAPDIEQKKKKRNLAEEQAEARRRR